MTPWPTATYPASGVMEIVVPAVSFPFVPRSWSQQMAPLLTSAGQVALDPVQSSAGLQRLVEARHWVVEGKKASAGHVVLDPVQLSATSQGPAAARHTVPAFPAGCVQVALVPSQMSRVQRSEERRVGKACRDGLLTYQARNKRRTV